MGTVSMPQGKGSRYHNLRLYEEHGMDVPENIDSSKTSENIVLIDKELTKAYDEIFGDSVAEYNAKQKRADRKIEDYCKHLSNSKNGEQLFYEDVVQWGSKEDFIDNPTNREIAKQCLIEYVEGFQKANPQLAIIGAYIHMDEASPHLHLDYVPVATGYKRGLSKRNSLDKAMKQMGYVPDGKQSKINNATQVWKASERARFAEICRNHGLEVEQERQWGRKNLSVEEYKQAKEEMLSSIERERETKLNTLSELDKSVSERKSEIDGLNNQKTEIDAQIAQKTAQIEELEAKKEILQKNPTREIADNPQVNDAIQKFVGAYKEMANAQRAEFNNEYYEQRDEDALAEHFFDSEVTIKKPFMGEPTVTMPYTQWVQFRERHNKLVDKFKEFREMFHKGLDKLMKLFDMARREPEYLNAAKYSQKFKQLQNKTSELEKTIRSLKADNELKQNQINYYMTKNTEEQVALEILDIFGSKMRNSAFVDPNGQEINMLDSMMEETELSFEAKNILNNRIDIYEENEYEHERDEHEWDWDFDR